MFLLARRSCSYPPDATHRAVLHSSLAVLSGQSSVSVHDFEVSIFSEPIPHKATVAHSVCGLREMPPEMTKRCGYVVCVGLYNIHYPHSNVSTVPSPVMYTHETHEDMHDEWPTQMHVCPCHCKTRIGVT